MAYERLDEALRQLKTDRERAEATEYQRKRAGEEAGIRFARIKSAVIGPIFDEVVARLVAEGFFGETVDEQNDASGPISLDVIALSPLRHSRSARGTGSFCERDRRFESASLQ